MCFVVFLPEKTGTFSANFNTYFMLKMLEMAFPGFKFQKFSGGGCPRTPLQGVASGHACVAMLRSVYNARSAPARSNSSDDNGFARMKILSNDIPVF